MSEAFKCIKGSYFTGADNTCMNAWNILHKCEEAMIVKLLDEHITDPSKLKALNIKVKLWGKGKRQPTTKEVRAILPMPPFVQLLDRLLAKEIDMWTAKIIELPPGCYCGALGGISVTDVVAGMSLLLEKSSDDEGKGAVAQADVAQFYDRLSPCLICQWMITSGYPRWLAAATAAMQSWIQITFRCGEAQKLSERGQLDR